MAFRLGSRGTAAASNLASKMKLPAEKSRTKAQSRSNYVLRSYEGVDEC